MKRVILIRSKESNEISCGVASSFPDLLELKRDANFVDLSESEWTNVLRYIELKNIDFFIPIFSFITSTFDDYAI